MNTIPIAAIKLVLDISTTLNDALTSNLEAFDFVDENTQRDYTQQEQESIAKYDISKIASILSDTEKKKDKINYFNKTVEKNDRRAVLTEIILGQGYVESSLGSIKPKEVFLFTPKCKCCGTKLESEYFFELPLKRYPYSNDRKCPSCSHNEEETICKCVCYSRKWDDVAKKLADFEPFFNMGFSLVVTANQIGYEICTIEDTQLFVDLTKDEKIHPSAILSIRNIRNDQVVTVNNGNVIPS